MFAIIGLGETGLSIARFLQKQKIDFWICDTRSNPPALAEFTKTFLNREIFLGEIPEKKLLDATKIILSPGLSRAHPAIQAALQKNIPVVGDIELFVLAAQAPIIAITGTNAKGTVTTMTTHILQQAGFTVEAGGNLGPPALDLLLKRVPNYYVLELSSFQLENTFSLQAEVATILNVSPDHLDYHGSLAAYIAAKQIIYSGAKHIVYRADDLATHPKHKTQIPQMAFGFASPHADQALGINQNALYFHHTKIIQANALKIKGHHNWLNALAASAIALSLDVDIGTIQEALKTYPGLPHRCEWLATKHKVDWYNDSKGTNVGATVAALEGIGPITEGGIILIGGGVAKGQDFSPLQPLCQKYVKKLILFGKDALALGEALVEFCPIVYVNTLAEAVDVAALLAEPQDAVLLSPACASTDMFKNFEDRGEQFRILVNNL